MLSEIPFIFFILVAFYCLAKYYLLSKTDYLFYAISLFLFTILIRPGIFYFAFGILIFYLFTIYKNWSIKRILILIIPVFLILFQMIKMKDFLRDVQQLEKWEKGWIEREGLRRGLDKQEGS